MGSKQRVHIVSLGCPKNRVDSEVMAGKLLEGSWEMVDDPDGADVIVVNTCSFIRPATEESIETVLEMAELKKTGQAKKLVVTGCMVQRYGRSLEAELPEVDHFLGTGEYHRIADILANRGAPGPKSHIDAPLYIHDESDARPNSWAPHSAWLKVSEGCDHKCAFCIIPQLRGVMRSRSIPSLVAEARRLADEGVVELNLVSQDSTAYGRDLRDGTDLGGLLRALGAVDALRWIRVHYIYPIGVPTSLLEAMAEEPKVCRYLDIPLQHASGAMLKSMRRGVTRDGQKRILDRIREHVPDVALRTTLITGFPGETDRDFAELLDFVNEQKFRHVGVFPYYQEDGTPAAELPNQVSPEVAEQRRAILMEAQAQISRDYLRTLVGKTVDVLVDGPSADHPLVLCGRLSSQAPEVDGQVFLDEAPPDLAPGSFLPVHIVRSSDYDLVGRVGPDEVETAP